LTRAETLQLAQQAPQGPEILESFQVAAEEPLATLTKKEKQQAKKEAFLQRTKPIVRLSLHIAIDYLDAGLGPTLPHSKSHNRRLRRKAKEQIIGGDLNDLQSAIAALDDDRAPESHEPADGNMPPPAKSQARPKPGKIGEGKKNPFSKSQRKHALYVCR
jgi:solute carrier family 35 protein F5